MDTTSSPSPDDRPLPLKILVVDDDPIVLRVLEASLAGAGHVVTTVGSAEEARAMIDHADVVVSDDNLPGMRGRALLASMRASGIRTPFILVTGTPSVAGVVDAFESGATSYLSKPVRTEDLLRKVARASHVLVPHGTADDEGTVAGPTADRRLHDALDRALASLRVVFQPICCLSGKQLFGYEALMRSSEPSLPHPGAVLEAAEALGRLHEVGRRVRALSAAAFVDAPAEALLFVNLHPLDLTDEELYADGEPLAAMTDRVVLEITERADFRLIADGRSRLERLRARGFRLAVDDLGTGYSGLASLVDLDPEVIKIDMGLVRDIDRDERKRRIVGSLVRLCGELGRLVTAEGVERREELDVLRELGCDLVQGYLLAAPAAPFPDIRW